MNRAIKRILLDVVLLDGEQDAAPSLEDVARRAKALLDKGKAKRKRVLERSRPRRAEEKESKDARRERIAKIREEVFSLASGTCEGVVAAPGYGMAATELHHILSGSDRRRLEATDNCVALCDGCHRDAAGVGVMTNLLKIPRLSTEARRALQRRIDKLRTTP